MIRLVDAVADPAAARAAALDEFRSGGLVVLPTETVYGLAVLPSGPRAVDVMFRRKGRADNRPVAVLVADVDQARTLVEPGPAFELLAAAFWPGPLTVVTTRGVGFSARLGGDQATVGVRCPDHELVRALAAEVGPLAVTSANRSGRPTEADARSAAEALGGDLLVLDGGPCTGAPSTVVDVLADPARVLRAGSIGREALIDIGLVLGDD